MENASKALIMAAEIMIGVLLLSLLGTLYYVYTNYHSEVQSNFAAKALYEFNAEFEEYEDRDLTSQDVLSICNLAKDYNTKFEKEIRVTVKVQGVPERNIKADDSFLEPNKLYIIKNIHYGSSDGKINHIEIAEKR